MNLDRRICSALYADDRAILIMGSEDSKVLKKIKEAIPMEQEQWLYNWLYNWGFKL